MIIHELKNIPKEDDLSDHLVHLFRKYPVLLRDFIRQFIFTEIKDLHIITRSQFSSIPVKGIAQIGKKPDIVLFNENCFILFENKRDAALKDDQLSSYLAAINELKKEREVAYVFIAPRTSRYTNIPPEFNFLTWDDIYRHFDSKLEELNHSDQNIIKQVFARYRLNYFQDVFDDIVNSIRPQINNITYPGNRNTSDYYSIHFTIRQTQDIVFSLGIFLQSPSYIKLFPFKVRYNNSIFTFNDSNPVIKKFREEIFDKLPYTQHKLKRTYPGYVIDLLQNENCGVEKVSGEIIDLLENQCLEMIKIYKTIIF